MRPVHLLPAFAAVLTVACSQESAEAPPPVAAPRPALGTFGIDTTAMDTSVKPGDDFYRYVNGAWVSTFSVPLLLAILLAPAFSRRLALAGAPWVATAPEQAAGTPVIGAVPAVCALVRAAVLTDAELVLVPAAMLPADAGLALWSGRSGDRAHRHQRRCRKSGDDELDHGRVPSKS